MRTTLDGDPQFCAQITLAGGEQAGLKFMRNEPLSYDWSPRGHHMEARPSSPEVQHAATRRPVPANQCNRSPGEPAKMELRKTAVGGGQFQANVATAVALSLGSKQDQFCHFSADKYAHSSRGPAKVLPNNTLVADLARCHNNLVPKVTRASERAMALLRSCAPSWLRGHAARVADSKAATTSGYVTTNVILTPSDDDNTDSNANDEDEQRLGAAPDSLERLSCASSSPVLHTPHTKRTRRKLKFQLPDAVLKLNTSLKPEDYNRSLSILTNDVRYQLHLLLFQRLQLVWTLFSTILCILVPLLLLAPLNLLTVSMAAGVWLTLQLLGALATRHCCASLNQMLEKAVAQANSYLMDHNLMLGVIHVGGLFTRARLVVPLLYFDTIQCREQIESIISVDLRKESDVDGPQAKWPGSKRERHFALNYSKIGLHKIGPEIQMSFAQSQLAKKVVLRYSQRWISFYDKRKLMFADDTIKPRHLSTGKCLCQFIEEHFKYSDFVQPHEGPRRRSNHVIETTGDTNNNQINDNNNACAKLEACNHLEQLVASWDKPARLNSFQLKHNSADLSLQQQLDLMVPTLSEVVSTRERTSGQQVRINIEQASETFEVKQLAASPDLQHERLEANSSPATEHSLDLTEASDLTICSNRNDELIRRLKLLLDSRKDEFARSIDQNQTQARFSAVSANRLATSSQDGSTQTINVQEHETINNNSNSGSSPISQLGKRFFSQTDGIFFMSSSKKSHQGVYGKQQQQILEIC